jgi:hypothetical protein
MVYLTRFRMAVCAAVNTGVGKTPSTTTPTADTAATQEIENARPNDGALLGSGCMYITYTTLR